MKGFAVLPIIIVTVVILAVFLIAGSFFKENQPNNFTTKEQAPAIPQKNQQGRQDEPEGGYGMKKPFYRKGSISLQHYWPSDGSFSAEETEILVINESDSSVAIKSLETQALFSAKITTS